jgi:hypothetical protein
MSARKVFNRSPVTKNLPDWPSEASAMQGVRQRKVMAMNGLNAPGKVVSTTSGRMGSVHFPTHRNKLYKIPRI